MAGFRVRQTSEATLSVEHRPYIAFLKDIFSGRAVCTQRLRRRGQSGRADNDAQCLCNSFLHADIHGSYLTTIASPLAFFAFMNFDFGNTPLVTLNSSSQRTLFDAPNENSRLY